MVMIYTTMAVALGRMLGSGRQVGPVRKRLARTTRDWAFSKTAIALDIYVNLIIFAYSAVSLLTTYDEKPNVPLRVWVAGYAVQCLVHAGLVWREFLWRFWRSKQEIELAAQIRGNADDDGSVRVRVREDGRILVEYNCWAVVSFAYGGDQVNFLVAMIWSAIGSYWLLSGGKLLLQNAPLLYSLSMVYQIYDFIYPVFWFAAGIVVGLSLYCIIPILNIIVGQEGASEKEVSIGSGVMVPVDTGSGDLASEYARVPKNAECCSNDEGIDLNALSINHQWNPTWLGKLLMITCPICKFPKCSKRAYEFEHASNSLFTV